jgi:hypothetical protein
MCLRACRSTALLATEQTIPTKVLFPSSPPIPPRASSSAACCPFARCHSPKSVPRQHPKVLPKLDLFWDPFSFCLFNSFWNPFSLHDLLFLVLEVTRGKQRFWRIFQTKSRILNGQAFKNPSEKESRRGSKNIPQEEMHMSRFGGRFGSLGAILVDFGPVLGHLAATWPPLGPRRSKGQG